MAEMQNQNTMEAELTPSGFASGISPVPYTPITPAGSSKKHEFPQEFRSTYSSVLQSARSGMYCYYNFLYQLPAQVLNLKYRYYC